MMQVGQTSPPEASNTTTHQPPTPWAGINLRGDEPKRRVKLEIQGLTSQLPLQDAGDQRLDFRDSVVAKLRERERPDLYEALNACHRDELHQVCRQCYRHRTWWNHCDRFYCPICQPRLTRERSRQIEWWAKLIRQPKHVVLTVRNTTTIEADHIRSIKRCLARLRRSKFAAGWNGGCWSLEVTNESRGWHLHLHLLVDARWIDAGQLAITWARITGQDQSIVRVRDCRDVEYLHEVTKYVAKGSDLASWSPRDLEMFIDAVQGQRTFGVFGSLFGRRTEWRDLLAAQAIESKTCECGCTRFFLGTQNEMESWLIDHGPREFAIPPPNPTEPPPQLELDVEFNAPLAERIAALAE